MMAMFIMAAVFCGLMMFGHKLHPIFEKKMVKHMMAAFGFVCAFAWFMELLK